MTGLSPESIGLTPSVSAELEQMLLQLTVQANETRAAAETQLNDKWLMQAPHLLLAGLARLAAHHTDLHMRTFSAVMLRRIALKQPSNTSISDDIVYWMTVGSEIRSFAEEQLLYSLLNEAVGAVRRKVCDAIAELARYMMAKGQNWVELLQAVFQCTKSPSNDHRESAYRIIATVPTLITEQDPSLVKAVFAAALADASPQVKGAAVKAAIYYLMNISEPRVRNGFVDMLLEIVNIITAMVAAKSEDEEIISDSVSYLIELAESYPKMFRSVLANVCPLMLGIMSNKELEPVTRQTALEFLLTLSETAPGMIRKYNQLHQALIPIVLEWVAELEDSSDWYTTDNLDDEDNDEDNIVGEQALDRIARAMGGKYTLPVAFTVIPQLLGSSKWQHRHAALMSISAIAEGCQDIMLGELDKVIDLVLPYFRDPHPRVRHSACSAIGQMSTDFGPELQRKFHKQVLSQLLVTLDDVEFPRVQCHAAAALVNFSEGVEKEDLEPYMDLIIQKLLVILSNGKRYMQEQAVTSIATVADRAEDAFQKYYSSIMPILMSILNQATGKEFRLLKGKAMECASLIALAVGKEVFGPHAHEFCNALKIAQDQIQDADDPQSSYLLSAWARVCKVLGEDFTPYLDYVMDSLLKSASLTPDFAIIDPLDEENDSKYSEEDGWEFIGADGQKIGIKTTVLEEKATALEMLICYIRELGGNFHLYSNKVMEIVVPLLKFYFHDEVRYASATAIPLLFASLSKAAYQREVILPTWHAVAAKIIEAANVEPDPAFLSHLLITFYDTMQVLGEMSLTPELCTLLINSIMGMLQEYSNRMKERNAARKDVEHDAEDEEVLQEEQENDETVLMELSRVIHEIFKSQKDTFLPYVEKLLPVVGQFAVDADPAARQWAICLYDDLVEYTGPASWPYTPHFLHIMMSAITDPAPDVRQPACYGIGVFAEFGGEQYTAACTSCLEKLFAVINHVDSRKEENAVATENAVSAIGKICHFMGERFDVAPILSAWLTVLPIVIDDQEAPHTYGYLLELLERGHPSIIGNGSDTIPKLVEIITKALVAEIMDEELTTKMVTVLRSILGSASVELRGQLWAGLSPKIQTFLTTKNFV